MYPDLLCYGIGKFAKTGTIVVRTLSKSWVTALINEYHYGVVIGTDANGVEYIIEMTDGRNVNILTKQKFIEPYNESHFRICSVPPTDFLPSDIYKKAEKFEYSVYSILNLNCIDFSYNCVYDIEPVRRGDVINKAVLGLNELGQKLNEIYASHQTSPEMKKFFEQNNTKLKQDQKIIAGSIKTEIN
jgi:hypothetical protein